MNHRQAPGFGWRQQGVMPPAAFLRMIGYALKTRVFSRAPFSASNTSRPLPEKNHPAAFLYRRKCPVMMSNRKPLPKESAATSTSPMIRRSARLRPRPVKIISPRPPAPILAESPACCHFDERVDTVLRELSFPKILFRLGAFRQISSSEMKQAGTDFSVPAL